jgi:hypothetical protein
MLSEIATLILRDLDGLRREVELYPDSESLFKTVPGLPNTGGNLALHLAGNLRHFVGATLGATGYVRNRDAEFAARSMPKDEVLATVAAARDEVARTFAKLDEKVLDQPFSQAMVKRHIGTRQMLLHLCVHLTYHLGQLDYHRRAATGDSRSAGAIPLTALGSAAD